MRLGDRNQGASCVCYVVCVVSYSVLACVRSAEACEKLALFPIDFSPDGDLPPPTMSGGVVTRRLHISGLTPGFSREALHERLATYGEVIDLEGCTEGHVDAVGRRLPYAFVTLRTTPAQLTRCMNTLSGALWKGAKLRVGEARPQWNDRLAAERVKVQETAIADAERSHERRRKWLRKRPWIGVEAPKMHPVSHEDVREGLWGWKETPAGHLVRPMVMRPERPIATPCAGHVPTRTRKKHRIFKRAPRLTIDPTRYAQEHLAGRVLEALGATDDSLRWEYVEDDAGAEWRAFDARGACVATDRVVLKPRRTYAFVERDVPDPEVLADEPDLPDTLFEQHEAPGGLFDDREPEDVPQADLHWWEDGNEPQDAPQTDSRWWENDEPLDDVAPPFDAPHRPTKLSDPGLFDLSDFSDGYDEAEHEPSGPVALGDERARALSFITDLFGDTHAEAPAEQPAASVLDGEATTEWPVDGQGEAPMDASEVPVDASEAPVDASEAPVDAAVHTDSLKDMFKPTEEEGTFSLFGNLAGEELEDLDEELGEAITGPASGSEPAPDVARVPEAPPISTRLPPLTTPATMGADGPSFLTALLATGSSPFWRVDSDEAMDEHWRARRAELTSTYKRMHREAIKKRRRRVAGARAGTGLGPSRGALPTEA